MNQLDCAVLVLSTDKYHDAWDPFFSFFYKFWQDCPFPVYLGNNFRPFQHGRVKQIFSKQNSSWSMELKTILAQLNYKYIILLLEDYFIYEKVNTLQIKEIISEMEKRSAAFTRLAAFPSKYNHWWPYNTIYETNGLLGEIQKGSKYRICLQTAIWNREVLLQLLNENENPWQFEIEASKRSENILNTFLCVVENKNTNHVHGPITYYCTAITKGIWMREAIQLCQKEKIYVDTTQRPIETKWEEIKRILYTKLPVSIKYIIDFFNHYLTTKIK